MLDINIPGWGKLALENLVLDFNGTLALDGELLPGAAERLQSLAAQLHIFVVTADTFGRARQRLAGLPCELTILPPGAQDEAKLAFVQSLGAASTAAVGNGRNDRLMLAEAALGIVVVQQECASAETLVSADVVAPDICAALDLLLNPLRLTATLRS